jgi:tRNA(Ile)-lysidine synthase
MRRGSESDLDQQLVAKAAADYGFPFRLLLPDMADLERGNFQENARSVRYRFFEKTRQENRHGAIALAHHQDDQIETLLLKIFRGAGIESWTGMKILENRVIRPLLNVTGVQVRKYAIECGIEFREDKSNLGSDYARNFLRLEYLPALGERIPGIRQNISNLPNIVSSVGQAFEWIGEMITKSETEKSGDVRIDVKTLLKMKNELRSAVILNIVKEKFGITLTSGALSRLQEAYHLQTGRYSELSGGIRLYREHDKFRLGMAGEDASKENIPDLIIIKRDELKERNISHNGYTFSLENQPEQFRADVLQLCADRLGDRLILRSWQNGDKFEPLGMQGTQKVSDHLTNRKIAGKEKNNALVLTTFEGIVCAVIFPHSQFRKSAGTIDNRFALDGKSTLILRIESG